MDNQARIREINNRQVEISKRFEILKYFLHFVMVVVLVVTLVQISLVYTNSEYKGTSPMKVSAYSFAVSQENMPWFGFLSQRSLFLE